VQPMYYKGPEYFKAGLVAAFAHQPDVRRMHFKCPDGSRSFTVYNTKLGVINVPDHDVICDDGTPLVTYDLTKLPGYTPALFAKPPIPKPVDK